jgi:hypothetical protein
MKLNEITNKKEPFVVIMLRKLLAKGEKVAAVYVAQTSKENFVGYILQIEQETDRQGVVEYVLTLTHSTDYALTTKVVSVFDVEDHADLDIALGIPTLVRCDIREYHDEFLLAPIKALFIPAPGNSDDLGGHDI